MYFVHSPRVGGTHRLDRARTPVTCLDCGHPAASPSASPIVRLARWVRHGNACQYAEHENGVPRHDRCGCTSAAHAT
jgi:hypothetical protein